jgi:hypothetical protein
MSTVTADIPTSLKAALDTEAARIKGSPSSVITAALAQYLGTTIHTLFQVSTSVSTSAISDQSFTFSATTSIPLQCA